MIAMITNSYMSVNPLFTLLVQSSFGRLDVCRMNFSFTLAWLSEMTLTYGNTLRWV
jgi:hypothetical protein